MRTGPESSSEPPGDRPAAALASYADPPPPEIPDHKLYRKIGTGSYGEVWLAQNILGEWRAVKIVYRARFDEARPYDREFEGISHYARFRWIIQPAAGAAGRGGESNEHFYYVMELADDASGAPLWGGTLTDRRRSSNCCANAVRCRCGSCSDRGEWLPRFGAPAPCRPDSPGRQTSNIVFVRGQAKLADIVWWQSTSIASSMVGAEGYRPDEGSGTPQGDSTL